MEASAADLKGGEKRTKKEHKREQKKGRKKIFMGDVIFQKREENTHKKSPKSKPSLEEPQPPLIF